MPVNFKKLGAALAAANLTTKPVSAYTKEEVEVLAQAVMAALIPPKDGPFRTPYLTEDKELIVPFDSDPKFHWWRSCGQSRAVTLREMKVSDEVWEEFLNEEDVPF